MAAGGQLSAVDRGRMAPSRRPGAPQRSLWTTPKSTAAQARWRVAPVVEAAAAVRRVQPPTARRPPLLEKVAAGWCRARGEAPPH